MLRAAYLALYAAFAVLGIGMAGRPALLWFRSLGLRGPVRAWDVPLGPVAFLLAVALAAFTVWLAVAAAMGRPRPLPVHASFLLVVLACVGIRVSAAPPRPPRDPAPDLLEALRRAADELDARYEARYVPDASVLNAALVGVPDPGFRHLGRSQRPHARVLSGADGPQLEALPEDAPATLYVAVSADRQSAWLTVLGAEGVLRLANGKPALIEARSGTHGLPGRDPLVPAYPRTKR